jgi:hypothetical protein
MKSFKVSYNFYDRVKTVCGEKELIIVRYELRPDGSIQYGCLNGEDLIQWHFDFELKRVEADKEITLIKDEVHIVKKRVYDYLKHRR